jgi:hypothetical protein
MRRLAIACVVLAACSHIFGLDGVPADDRDGDHWPDGADNCPDTFNPDQSDIDLNDIGDRCQVCMSPTGLDDDGDGIPNECDGCDNRLPDDNHDGVPDACEHLNDAGMIVIPIPDAACPLCQPCALGPPHDEDHDEVADACDNCPIYATLFGAGDADNDGVGDQCDVSTGPSHQIFDAFVVPNQDWFETGMWTVSGDALHVIPNTVQTAYRQLGTGRNHFTIRTRMTDQGNPLGSADAGVIATRNANVGSTGYDEQLECRVQTQLGSMTGSVLVFELFTPGNTTPPVEMLLPGPAPYRVELEYDAKTNAVRCAATPDGGNPVQIEVDDPDPSQSVWTTGLFAVAGGGTASFEYYDVVTDD